MKPLDANHILTRIVEAKKKRLQVSRMRIPEAIVKHMAETAKPVPSFREALLQERRVRIIAEVKKTSPSKGLLRKSLDPAELAEIYTKADACAISVVTEEDFFEGDLGWINKIRAVSELPVLRKDFIWDPFQLYETRASGASAVLLIVAMLQPGELKRFMQLSQELKLDPLVEVHDEAELSEALEAGASIIGINNRNLKTFEVTLQTSIRLAKLIPQDRLFVVESGIHTKIDIDLLIDAGADAFLIGEHFLTAPDPAAAIRGLL